MPTFIHGRKARIFIGGYDFSPVLRDLGATKTADTAETSAFGTNDKSYVIGMMDGTMSFTGMYDLDESATGTNEGGAKSIVKSLEATFGGEAGLGYSVYPNGLSFGAFARLMDADQTDFSSNASTSDVVTVSIAAQADGGHVTGNVLMVQQPVTNAVGVDGASFDTGVATATTYGALAVAHVTANTMATNGRLILETSANGTIWAEIASKAVVAGAVGSVVLDAPPGTTVQRYLRFAAEGSASGAMTVTASAGRRFVG